RLDREMDAPEPERGQRIPCREVRWGRAEVVAEGRERLDPGRCVGVFGLPSGARLGRDGEDLARGADQRGDAGPAVAEEVVADEGNPLAERDPTAEERRDSMNPD